jgi:uncharacterized protein YbjT (DUF2867 family)
MSDRKRILVTGATGAQGGGVARHLLARGKFGVRCLTRNPNSEKAVALARAGAEVVKGDLGDASSLRAALEGCCGVFGVTNFWEHFAKEYEHGKNLIDAVAAANLEHFVFSTLPPAKRISGGRLDVPHFDLKAELEEYTRGLGLPATFTHVAFYFENFLYFFPPQKQGNGSFAFGFPQGDTPLAGVAVEDVGGVVATIFERPAEFMGKTIGIVGDDLPPARYAELMTQILHTKVVYHSVSREAFAALGFPGAEDLANMFEFNRLYIPNRQADLEQSRSLYADMQDFPTWLKANSEKFQPILQG